MKMDKVAGSGNDEFYTPSYAIEPILEHVKEGSKVWCPFDTKESLFVKMLEEKGCEVISTSLINGQDFFELVDSEIVDWCDYIISNPPYSLKGEVLQALFETEKPFAMLLGCVGLFESQKRFNMLKDNKFELLIMNKRVSYFKDYEEQKPSKNPPFSSWYICSKMLPQQIYFKEIDKKLDK